MYLTDTIVCHTDYFCQSLFSFVTENRVFLYKPTVGTAITFRVPVFRVSTITVTIGAGFSPHTGLAAHLQVILMSILVVATRTHQCTLILHAVQASVDEPVIVD